MIAEAPKYYIYKYNGKYVCCRDVNGTYTQVYKHLYLSEFAESAMKFSENKFIEDYCFSSQYLSVKITNDLILQKCERFSVYEKVLRSEVLVV